MAEWLIVPVDPADARALDEARTLFSEYHEWLGEVVCATRLTQEIAGLPGVYAPPLGRLLLAHDASGVVAGVVAVRPFEGETVCEMKRLYVHPASRGDGLGRRLAEEAIAGARELGYSTVLLTTLPEKMAGALAIYRALGFEETEPFEDHSHVGDHVEVLFMRLDLGT